MPIFNGKLSLSAVFSLFLLLASCEKKEDVPASIAVSMAQSEVGSEAGSRPIHIKATASWTLKIQYPGSAEDWATLSVREGGNGEGDVELSFDRNTSGRDRQLKLVGTCGRRVSVWNLVQSSRATETIPSDVIQSRPGNWMELPAVSEADDLWFISHRHQVRGKETRDWSYNWDRNRLVSHWVAYPLNKGLIGGGQRSNAWDFDPLLPQKYQPNLYHSYRGHWQRGHQLPSADRLKTGENERTFYYTNMTPQDGELNENAWAGLESRVRSWSFKLDTLYVVTGCTVRNSRGTASDNNGKAVTVPGGYFKALLGYSKGGSASMFSTTTGGYTSIGFYFDNTYASDIMSHAMTIEELEKKTGLDFFVNLPSAIGETLARRTETANDEFWKNN